MGLQGDERQPTMEPLIHIYRDLVAVVDGFIRNDLLKYLENFRIKLNLKILLDIFWNTKWKRFVDNWCSSLDFSTSTNITPIHFAYGLLFFDPCFLIWLC